MSNTPVHVAVQGISSGTIVLAVIQLVLGGGVIAALVRAWPALKKIANEREANLLSERAEEMNKMRDTIDKLEARLDAKDIQHEAERAADRHRINNLDQALKAFFILVKRHPEDAAGAAAEIEAMRAQQMEEEKREGVALRALVATLTTGKPASAS
jgi:hypothetical protein